MTWDAYVRLLRKVVEGTLAERRYACSRRDPHREKTTASFSASSRSAFAQSEALPSYQCRPVRLPCLLPPDSALGRHELDGVCQGGGRRTQSMSRGWQLGRPDRPHGGLC